MTQNFKTKLSSWIVICLTVALGTNLSLIGAKAQSAPDQPSTVGLVLWLDASEAATVKADAQGHLLQWLDRSGQHHDVSARDEASRPQLVSAAMNGKSVVRFSGHQALGQPKAISAALGSVTVFIVMQRSSDAVTGEPPQRLFSSQSEDRKGEQQPPNFSITVDRADQSKAYHPVIINREQTNVALGPLALGHSLQGDIAEVLVYNRAFLSAGDRQLVLDYLHEKWDAAIPANPDEWTRVGGLSPLPAHLRQYLPLSDQKNHDKWVLDKQFSDEFTGASLEAKRWHINPTSPGDWAGRPPALFEPSNVTVSGGALQIAFRKGDVPEMQHYPNQGYAGYTSAFIRTNQRSGYGYYEVEAEPMNSAGSSAFWLTDTGLDDNKTEIDIFEIGAKGRDFERKYNMTTHVWATPQEKRHWAAGGVWIAPWNLGDTYHVYGFDWSKDFMTWYVDGVPVRKAKNTNYFFPMQIMLDSEAMWTWFGPVNDADLPSFFRIKYLRVWRHQK